MTDGELILGGISIALGTMLVGSWMDRARLTDERDRAEGRLRIQEGMLDDALLDAEAARVQLERKE